MVASGHEKVHPDCREFVQVLEELLYEAKRDGRLKRLTDFYADHPSYLDIRRGKVFNPSTRREVLRMANELQLTSIEKNKLLVAAGHVQEDEEPEGEALNESLDTAQRILDYLPLPAYVVTRDDVIRRWNPLVPTLFFLGVDELRNTPEERRAVLRYIFDSTTPVYQLLTNFSTEYAWWRYTAKLNIFRFKTDNFRSRNKPWYAERVKLLMDFPEFATMWNAVQVDTGVEEVKKEMPEKMPFPEYVTKMYTPDRRQVKVRGLQMRVVDTDFPRIVAYIPDDKTSIHIFTELGIPTPDNGWRRMMR